MELLWLKLHDYLYYGGLGIFAALVGLLYQAARASEMPTLLVILATLSSGFYLGIMLSTLIPPAFDNKDAIVLLAGASGMKAFEIVLGAGKNLLRGLIKDKSSCTDQQ